MKKTLTILLIILVLVSGLFLLTGCKKEEPVEEPAEVVEEPEEVIAPKEFDINAYTKEVDSYSLTTQNGHAASFGFAKELAYQKTNTAGEYRAQLTNEAGDMIEVQYFYVDVEKSSAVSKKEQEDFNPEQYADYSKLKINDFEGWEVYRVFANGKKTYEVQLFQEGTAGDGFSHAIKVTVIPKDKAFDTKAFVESDDFQYLLHSAKIDA